MAPQYQEEDIESFLQKHNIKHRVTEGGAEFECTCIYCGKDRHMYVVARQKTNGGKVRIPGMHKCMKCGEGGGLVKMKRTLGDLPNIKRAGSSATSIGGSTFKHTMHEPPPPSVVPPARLADRYHAALMQAENGTTEDEYILLAWAMLTEDRGISPEVIRAAKVGYMLTKSGIPCLAFPYFDRRGNLFNFKYLGLFREKREGKKDKKFIRRFPDCASDLYGLDALDTTHGSVILVEGEIDRLTAMVYGFKNVLSVPNGAGNSKWDHLWTRHLGDYETVYISFDMDDEGRDGARDAAEKIGRLRCYDVHLPLNDLNNCLQAGIPFDEITAVFEAAERFPGGEIKTAQDMRAQLKARLKGGVNTVGVDTGFEQFNAILGGWRTREVTIVTGDTGTGKTTMCLALALLQAINGIGVLFCNFEMAPLDIGAILCSMICKKDFLLLTEEELDRAIDYLDTLPFHFLDAFGAVGMDNLKEVIEYASRYLGIGAFWLDPLQYALTIEDQRNSKHIIDNAMMLIKSLTMDLSIRIGMVVHPKNIAAERKSQKVEMADLPGSARIKQDTDNIIRLWVPRLSDGQLSSEVEATFLKIRSTIGRLGTAYLRFDPNTMTYTETTPKSKKAA